MSLILDALRRAERERQTTPVTVFVDRRLPGTTRRNPHWPWLIAAALLFGAVAGVALWQLRVNRADTPEPAATAVVTARPAPAVEAPAPPVAGPGLTPRQPEPAVVPGTEAAASLDDLAVTSLEPEPAPPAQPVRPSPAAPARATEPAPELPADTEAPQASPAVPAALTQPAPLRKLREMPPEYRADFPALHVEIHFYDPNPARRFVRINDRRYREGERLAEGPVIVEIVRKGIVFDFRGHKLLYPLGR